MLQSLDRSFLFGRLLAVLERRERIRRIEKMSGEYNLFTNCHKFWIQYRIRPASTLQIILDMDQHHAQKLIKNNFWMHVKIECEIKKILQLLEQHHLTQDLNRPLNHLFVWGYYSELSF